MAEPTEVLTGIAALPPIPPEATTHDVQAAAEGVTESADHIEFLGEKFRLANNISIMPLAAFANAGRSGMTTADMDSLAAMYRVIRSVIHRPALYDEHGNRVLDQVTGKPARDETEWHRFEELADDECDDPEDLMNVVNQALEVISARPPKRRGTSSASSPPTSPRSRAPSSSPGTRHDLDGFVPISELGR